MFSWDSQMISTVIGALNSGFLQTLKLFFLTLLGAIPLGLVIACGSMNRWAPIGQLCRRLGIHPTGWFASRSYHFKPVQALTRLVVWVIRGTPLMLQLIILYYIPGQVMGYSPWGMGEGGRFVAAATAFIINYACYFSEIYRGGIQSIPVGQQEAGLVLGMTRRQIFFQVTLMQMIKRIVPPMSNEIITLVKDTSIARIISWQELIWAGYAFMKGSHGYSGLIWPLFFTGVYYLLFNGFLTLFFGWLERKLDYFR